MDSQMFGKAERSANLHEDRRDVFYKDDEGNWTVATGYNATARGLDGVQVTQAWMDKQLTQDINYFYSRLCTFPWFLQLNTDRQVVLIDLCFMGFKKLCGFTHMIAALEKGDYETAADEIIKSQVAPNRAKDLANGMRSGVYDV